MTNQLLSPGHSLCAGCGVGIALNLISRAAPEKLIVTCATSCLEVTTTMYPWTAWKVPWIHAAFETTSSIASGVEAAIKKLGKDWKVLALAGDGGCYVPKTRILTINGFKNVEELKKNETVWSVNPKTLEIEKASIKKMHVYDYNNKIISVNHNFVHFDVSLNHNIPLFDKIDKKLFVIKAHELLNYGRSDRINIITGGLRWKGKEQKYFELPEVTFSKYGSNKKNIRRIPMNPWLEFFGYWLSEGHLSVRSSKRERYNIFISQTNIKNRKKIKSCLSKLPFNFWCTKDRFIISNQRLWSYLKQFREAKNKSIPPELKNLHTSQLKILFDALILGDGSIIKQKNSTVFNYSTISQKLKDDIIEIALKLGYRVHLNTIKRKGRPEYYIRISSYKPPMLANLRKKHISSYDYHGKVYCPELEKNHILIIEKNGRISLNMNSFDIGLQALSGMLERGHKVTQVCLDNECYANTGVQRSGATPYGAWTTTSPPGKLSKGKTEWKKPLTDIVAAHRTPYVASASVAYPNDLVQKMRKAFDIQPSFVHIHCPCPTGWKFGTADTVKLGRLAVETGMWALFEIERGQFRLSKRIVNRKPVQEYLSIQGRFKHLPPTEIEKIQKKVDNAWTELEQKEKCGLRFLY